MPTILTRGIMHTSNSNDSLARTPSVILPRNVYLQLESCFIKKKISSIHYLHPAAIITRRIACSSPTARHRPLSNSSRGRKNDKIKVKSFVLSTRNFFFFFFFFCWLVSLKRNGRRRRRGTNKNKPFIFIMMHSHVREVASSFAPLLQRREVSFDPITKIQQRMKNDAKTVHPPPSPLFILHLLNSTNICPFFFLSTEANELTKRNLNCPPNLLLR